jgi:GT2 family glycosyltransferase
MLTLAPIQTVDETSQQRTLSRLGGSVFLLCWTFPAPLAGKPVVALAADGRRMACASVTLRLADGRMRIAVAFRDSGQDGLAATLTGLDPVSRTSARIEPAFSHDLVDAVEIARELTPGSRLALAKALVGPWPALFGLLESASYLAFLRQFLLALSSTPAPAAPVAALVEGKILVESWVPPRFGPIAAAWRLDSAGLTSLRGQPRLGRLDRAGKQALHLVLDETPARSNALLVLQGAGGIALRALPARAATPTLGRWWAGKGSSRDGLRSWLVEQLSGLSESGRLLAIEMQRRLPLAVQSVRRQDDLPSAELDLALCNEAGLLLGGWYRDPDGLLDQILLHRGSGEPQPILDRLDRFPALLPGSTDGERRPATGFAGLIPGYAGGAPVLQPRCELRLKSGTSLFLRPAVQPADATAIRARTLAAIPPQHLTQGMIARTLAPVLAACQADLRGSTPEPSLTQFGQPPVRPTVSVVIPLYKAYEFLRVQVAAFAGDPSFVESAELIYVLDCPEHEGEVAHLLGGLFRAYGLPMQLVTMGRNGGFSAACNAGAAQAKAETLALVNSDVIPTGDGWLPALVRKLDRRGKIGMVGPKLLYHDGSLQHAGLYFQRDDKGCWFNHHYFKGMPGSYGPANRERPVPGVTGACMVMPRALYAELGGFDDAYVIGDYEDSDLCLKVRRTGFEIAYVPSVALYHLERQSIARSQDYMRGAASQHNAWLQTQRWDTAIADLMERIDSPPAHAAESERPMRPMLRRATAA